MPASSPARAPGPDLKAIRREDSGPVAVLTLDRADRHNALSAAMLAELRQALAAIADDGGVRAVVLAASGPSFCAGHDLRELAERRSDPDGGRTYLADIFRACSAMMLAIVQLPQPVIAAVQGVATAAGCQLVASCDLAVAARTATFRTPGVDIGLFCSTPMVALSRNVPPKHALGMLLTGDAVPAEEALRIGLLNRVVEPGTEREHAIELAHRIASKSALAVRLGKEAFYRQMEMGLSDAYRFASEVMVDNMLRDDAAEGIGAFLDKRGPEWKDR